MPTINLGQVRPVYRGEWSEKSTYRSYDWVTFDGGTYLALKDVPAGYEPASQTAFWTVFGTPGASGEKGEKGDTGPQGPAVALSDAVNSSSSTTAASSKAVKTAYDRASTAISTAAAAQSAAYDAQSAAEAAQSTAEAAQSTAAAANANSGVTAASYGPSANAAPAHGGSFKVPYFTVNAKGKITAASTKTVTLPAAPSVTDITGNAATATKLKTARTITIKTTTTGSGSNMRPATGQTASVTFDGSGNVTFSVPVRELYNCTTHGSWC